MCSVLDKQIKKGESKKPEGGKNVKKICIDVETGEMIVKDDAGETKTLMADPKAGVDLKMLKEGDPVSVESDSDGVIKSLKAGE